jgi:glutathione peroxidase-family protein
MNVVNTSPYTDENRNIELRNSMNGDHGGTVAGEPDTDEPWLQDPTGVLHGKIRATDVRVYRGREYIERLAALKGDTPVAVDPEGRSNQYFVLEAAGRAGDTLRVVSALVRENEPFSSFVFFQNRHPLGISGAPRGLIHSNDRIEFYFPNGNYLDSVSAVNGFSYEAGADPGNTNLASGNPEAERIDLDEVDFAALKTKANAFVGADGLDAEIKFFPNGTMRVRQFTPPRFEEVERSWTGDVFVGWTTETVTETQPVQIGTTQEERTRQIIVGYTPETYTVDVPVYEEQQVERSREDPVYEEQQVERTRQVPIYELQTVTKTRWVQVFVPYDDGTDAGGGTAVGGEGGVAGEYEWVEEEYQTQENVLVGYETETYYTTEMVQVGTTTVTWTETVQVQVGTTQEERTRNIPIYDTETYTVDVPVYEDQQVEVERDVPVYETQTYTWTEQEFFEPTLVDTTVVDLGDAANTVFIDGRITRLYGDINGRVTIVGNEKVRITGNLRYMDDDGDTAMLNGSDYAQSYRRNADYNGDSVLGVIARDDVLFTGSMPDQAEINATLLSAQGRVGIDGFAITEAGEPTKDYYYGLTPEEQLKEEAYDATSYETRRFRKDSLRRIGGLISNDRILETYIRPRSDGTSYVDAGFKRGKMRFDFNLMFNPPPNFVEVPRPVVTSIAPVYFLREYEN